MYYLARNLRPMNVLSFNQLIFLITTEINTLDEQIHLYLIFEWVQIENDTIVEMTIEV